MQSKMAKREPLRVLLLWWLPLLYAGYACSMHNASSSLNEARGAARSRFVHRNWYNHPRPFHRPNLPDQVARDRTSFFPFHPRRVPPVGINPEDEMFSHDMYGRRAPPLPHSPCPPCPKHTALCPIDCKCIPEKLRCDGASDCSMGEDELECEQDHECAPPHRLRCPGPDSRCIAQGWICDGKSDCSDGWDEQQNCDGSPKPCNHSGEFSCHNGLCIPLAWRCDGDDDCRDNSDELNCTALPCTDTEFTCADRVTCIPLSWHCDGTEDCTQDGSDEIGCEDLEVIQCDQETEFACKYPLCVLKEYRCDGDNDCGDWSDETGVECRRKGIDCSKRDFKCRSGECIWMKQRCNGVLDCDDGEDEEDCGSRSGWTCAPDQHTCSNGYCIDRSWVCDGIHDCPNGEDEEKELCGAVPTCNNQTHFACSEPPPTTLAPAPPAPAPAPPARPGVHAVVTHLPFDLDDLAAGFSCIPRRHVCDGRVDCVAGDDERECPVEQNCTGSAGCAQLCLRTADGREVCGCRQGYRLAADGRGCEDVDECADEQGPPCQQLCTNSPGSYTCGCSRGYKLRPDGHSCKSEETPATLLLTNRIDIRQVNLNNRRTHPILKGLHNAVPLDFHWQRGEVYWADYSMHVIRKAALNGSLAQDVIRWGLQNPTGLAVDWVHGLLFWSDSELRRVEVADLRGSMPHTIAHMDLDKPRDVAVHPGKAWVFWTDWGPKPKIERVEMNGDNRRAILSDNVQWPNGLAIDYDSDRIFWTDAMLHKIESADFDGGNRRVVLAKGLPHPFALTLFEDTVYWTDWHTRSVMSADKLNGKRVQVVVDRLNYPMQIHSCHPKRQPNFENHCPKGERACSHLCLPSASSYVCVCPVGVKLRSNGYACDTSPEKLLVYVRKKEIRLREMEGRGPGPGARPDPLGLGSSARDTVLAVDGVRHAQAVAWDSREDVIFWSDYKAATISRARRDGSDQRVVVGTDLENPMGLAVDWVRRRLYFSDYMSLRIETTDLDGGDRVVLLYDLSGPRHLTLFPAGGLMFWSSWGSPKPMIEMAGMDGKRRKEFVSEKLVSPGALAIDQQQRRLYWTDPGLGYIDSINVDGTDRREVLGKLPHPYSIAVFDGRVYWTDTNTKDLNLVKEGDGQRTVRSGVTGLLGVDVFHQRRAPVRTACDQDSNFGCAHVCLLSNNHYNAGCACRVGYRPTKDEKGCEHYPGPYLLLARRLDVRKVPLGMPFLVDTVVPTPELQNTVAVDADKVTGDVYWSDSILSAIMKTSKDGDADNATIVISSGLDTPYGLAVDSVGRKLYWADSGRRIVEVSELDGSRRKVLVWEDLRNPCALTLHYPAGLMFWSDWGETPESPGPGRIERAAMDGSQRMVVVADNVGWPGGLAVYEERLYWSDVMHYTVESAALDGADRVTLLHRLRDQPASVAVLQGYVYWGYRGEAGALHRARLPSGPPRNAPINATEDMVVRPGLPFLMDVKAIDTTPLPADACARANCSDLCLRVPGGHACACPTGVPLGRDGRTCNASTPEMLVFATPDGLARIATGSLQRFHDVLLPVPHVRNVVALDFHWGHQKIVFADASLCAIRSVNMKDWGRPHTIVGINATVTGAAGPAGPAMPPFQPTGVAVDWLADNVFWTDAGRRAVEVARLDGSCRKKIVSTGLNSPRAIVVHPTRGLIFWTDWGPVGAAGTKIERAQLDGSERRAIVSEDLNKPNGLALDVRGGRLYWANFGETRRIEACNIDGKNRVHLVADAHDAFGLTVLGDHVFWTDFDKRTLERADKRHGRDRMTVETMMDKVEDIKAVSPSRQPRSGAAPCGNNNGGCSHLCLATEKSLVCACPDVATGTPCTPGEKPRPEYEEEDFGGTDDQALVPPLHNATAKSLPVVGMVFVALPSVVAVAALALCVAYLKHYIRRQPRGARGQPAGDKLRPSKAGKGHVLTYANPNYLAERESAASGAGSSGIGSLGSGSGGSSWMRRLKYDRSTERVFDVRDDGRHGAASPEILSLINSPGSVIAENSSCVMEGITPPPTPPPPPRTARTARLQPLGGPGPRPGHYAVN